MIPKIIHFIWLGSPVPDWAQANMAEFSRLNPEHEISLHTDDGLLLPEYRKAWDRADHPSTRSDLLRYSILEQFGGWYADVDYWPLRPLEDAERAFCLDGSRLFAARMNNPRINNGILASAPGAKAWRAIAGYIREGGERGAYGGRTVYGPPLMTRLAKERPELMRVSDWPWFHGIRDVHAARLYHRLRRTGDSAACLRYVEQATGGQLPFAFHLWAHTHGEGLVHGATDARPLALVMGKRAGDDDSDRPYRSIAAAFEALGWQSMILPWNTDRPLEQCPVLPEAVVVWNGYKHKHGSSAAAARACGAQVFYVEHGFFDRNAHFQFDHAGILHRASWAASVSDPAPDEGPERLARFVPAIAQQRSKMDGYVLVLGQVPGDAQLYDSEIQGPVPLERAVRRALPRGTKVFFRPHPQLALVKAHPQHESLPRWPMADETAAYRETRHGSGLAEALAGARCVVTINSNAILEALVAGVPCLAFGPSLAITAGAARGTSLATLAEDMSAMLRGWTAPDQAVRNYLEHLACRQWSIEELADPDLLARRLAEAGLVNRCAPQLEEALA